MRDPPSIAAFAVGGEQRVDQGMPDWRQAIIRGQVAFGDIGRVLLPIHQDAIPRFVARRAAFRHGFVPFVGFRKNRIDIENDAAVAPFEVGDQLSNVKKSVAVNQKRYDLRYYPNCVILMNGVYGYEFCYENQRPAGIDAKIDVWISRRSESLARVGNSKDRLEDNMKFSKTLIIAAVPLLLAAGCETMSESDRMMVDNATKSATDAQAAASRAADAANKAAASAAAAARAAEAAAAEAKAAGDKADRVFRRGMRK